MLSHPDLPNIMVAKLLRIDNNVPDNMTFHFREEYDRNEQRTRGLRSSNMHLVPIWQAARHI
jgi:hypothetical protein